MCRHVTHHAAHPEPAHECNGRSACSSALCAHALARARMCAPRSFAGKDCAVALKIAMQAINEVVGDTEGSTQSTQVGSHPHERGSPSFRAISEGLA
jgi:hypothetical protein